MDLDIFVLIPLLKEEALNNLIVDSRYTIKKHSVTVVPIEPHVLGGAPESVSSTNPTSPSSEQSNINPFILRKIIMTLMMILLSPPRKT